MTNSVTFPTNLGGDGSTVTDDDNASTGLGNGGHRTRFVPAMGQVVAVANVLTQRLSNQSDTSSTSIAIATGNKTFVTAGFYEWAVGMWVTVTSAANPANFMFGQVTSWTTATNTVIIDVDSVGGSGTYSDWTIALSAYSSIGDYLTDADIGVTVQPYDADTPTVAATKAEMQAGTETAIRSMSPLRVAEAISGLVSGRNKIINGAMMIDQRNAGASVTVNGSYPVDRWPANENSAGAATIQQSTTAPAGFTNSLKWTTTSASGALGAGEYGWVRQLIEGYNISDLGWGASGASSVTLSFWVRSSLTGTFGGAITNGNENRSYPFTYTINVADTWEQKTVTVPGDTTGTWKTNNEIGIRVWFGMGVGSTYSGTSGSWVGGSLKFSVTGAVNVLGTLNATWYVTGIQLEKGETATPFENRLYGNELLLCQRYALRFGGEVSYERIGNIGTAYAVNAAVLNITSMVPMRASPSMNYGGTINLCDGNTNIAMTSAVLGSGGAEVSTKNFGIVAYTSGGMTIYRPYYLITANTSAYFIFSAEL